jgi:hypothetical protein
MAGRRERLPDARKPDLRQIFGMRSLNENEAKHYEEILIYFRGPV